MTPDPPPLTEEEERRWRSNNEAVVFPSNQLRRLFATLDAERAELRRSRARIQELEVENERLKIDLKAEQTSRGIDSTYNN